MSIILYFNIHRVCSNQIKERRLVDNFCLKRIKQCDSLGVEPFLIGRRIVYFLLLNVYFKADMMIWPSASDPQHFITIPFRGKSSEPALYPVTFHLWFQPVIE